MSSEDFFVRFALGLGGSLAGLLLVLGFVFPSPRPAGQVLGTLAERTAPVEPRLNRVASVLATKQVDVRCWSRSDWPRVMREQSAYAGGRLTPATLGVADIGGTHIDLSPTVCHGLVDLVDRRARPGGDPGQMRLASALVTLTHEPQHSKGIAAEAVAECYAIQFAPRTAALLGVGRAYAASLLRTYWRHYSQELADYRSAECRRGGALDLGRADSVWS